jgi:anti-anti-sigma factor
MRLQIRRTASDSTQALICLVGEVDLDAAPALAAALKRAGRGKAKKVVLDLSQVTYLSSSGVSAILDACGELEARGGELILTGARGSVRVVLDLLGLSCCIRQDPAQNSSAAGAGGEHRG